MVSPRLPPRRFQAPAKRHLAVTKPLRALRGSGDDHRCMPALGTTLRRAYLPYSAAGLSYSCNVQYEPVW